MLGRFHAVVDLEREIGEGALFGATAPMAIDDGVAKRAVEPRDDRVFVAHLVLMDDGLCEGSLHEIFGERAVAHATFDERNEVATARAEDVDGLGHEELVSKVSLKPQQRNTSSALLPDELIQRQGTTISSVVGASLPPQSPMPSFMATMR